MAQKKTRTEDAPGLDAPANEQVKAYADAGRDEIDAAIAAYEAEHAED